MKNKLTRLKTYVKLKLKQSGKINLYHSVKYVKAIHTPRNTVIESKRVLSTLINIRRKRIKSQMTRNQNELIVEVFIQLIIGDALSQLN